MERRSRIIRSIWAICLSFAGLNHARILFQHGLSWDYGGVGWASTVYWSSLTVIDPTVAIMLFVMPGIGIIMSIILIITNVIHNLTVTAIYTPDGDLLANVVSNPFIVSQIAFMIFVGITARPAWSGRKSVRLRTR